MILEFVCVLGGVEKDQLDVHSFGSPLYVVLQIVCGLIIKEVQVTSWCVVLVEMGDEGD